MTELAYQGRDGCPLFAAVVDDPPPADAAAAAGAAAPARPVLVLMHGGGPDHRSLLPLARRLADLCTVVLPDVRGYGRSVCTDPARHTWARYADDVTALLDHLGVDRAIVGGAGLGSTVALRAAVAHPDRVEGVVLISVEEIEDDHARADAIAFLDRFADRVRTHGIEAAWAPILPGLAPVIGAMVRDAIPRSHPDSIAAAAAIGRDRSFRGIHDLAGITAPTLIIPGMDERHPAALAEELARLLPRGQLAPVTMAAHIRTVDDFARAFAPAIRTFVGAVVSS